MDMKAVLLVLLVTVSTKGKFEIILLVYAIFERERECERGVDLYL